MTDAVYHQAPHDVHGSRWTRNRNDGIYRTSEGQTLITVFKTDDRWKGTFNIALHIS